MCADKGARRCAGGFSLLETIVFIVVVGAGLAGVLSVFTLTATKSADPMVIRQAVAIGEAFLDEILSRVFSDPGAYTGAATDPRSNFADVDDYNGYSSAGIKTRSNQVVPGLTAYSVSVTVTPTASAIGSGANLVPAGEMKLISVTVTDPAGATYPTSAYKANF